jgi:hypothetical protein
MIQDTVVADRNGPTVRVEEAEERIDHRFQDQAGPMEKRFESRSECSSNSKPSTISSTCAAPGKQHEDHSGQR